MTSDRVSLAPRDWIVLGVVAVAALGAASLAPNSDAARVALALVFTGELVYVCWRAPETGVLLVLAWLGCLGTTRRFVSFVQADPAKDPLLVVAPVAVGLLALRAFVNGVWRRRSVLMYLVVAFSVVAMLGAFNPDESDRLAGVAGLLFWLVPVLWYWVARSIVDDRLMRRVVLLVAAVTVADATYGILQAAVGFPGWDAQWIRERGYASLFVSGPQVSRPFGTASSAVEYGLTVALGVFVLGLLAVRAVRRHLALRAVVFAVGGVLCAVALAVSGVRTAVVTLVVTVCVAVLVRLRPRPVVIAGLIAVLVAAYAALWVVPAEDLGRDGTQGSLRRIVLGVRNPFDREASTLIEHVDLVVDGFENVPSKPFGRGTSATNLAGERFGGGGFDTEFDVSNGAAAFGFPGIVLTAAIVLWGLVLAVSRAWRRRDLLCLAALGFVLVPFRFWFNGGHYFLAALVWLALGWFDRAPRLAAADDRAGGRVAAATVR